MTMRVIEGTQDSSIDDATMPTPDLADLQQDDHLVLQTVPVQHDGPITAYLLPSRYAQTWTDSVGADSYLPILSGTEKRARALIVSATQPVYISTSGNAGSGTWWPAGVPYEIRHAGAVSVICATAGQTTLVGITVESWAD